MSERSRAVRLLAVLVGVALSGFLAAGPALAQPVDRGIWLTDADGASLTPGALFGDEHLVPGQQLDASFLVHHRGDVDGPVEVRADALSDPGEFSDDVTFTLSTSAGTTEVPLVDLLHDAVTIDLTDVPADGALPVEVSVALPSSAGNDTREKSVTFELVVTAYGQDLLEPGAVANHPETGVTVIGALAIGAALLGLGFTALHRARHRV